MVPAAILGMESPWHALGGWQQRCKEASSYRGLLCEITARGCCTEFTIKYGNLDRQVRDQSRGLKNYVPY